MNSSRRKVKDKDDTINSDEIKNNFKIATRKNLSWADNASPVKPYDLSYFTTPIDQTKDINSNTKMIMS